MSRKPEAVFRDSVHKYLTKLKRKQSMYTPYSAGTPDSYYLGNKNSLWIEWKFYKQLPKEFHSFDKFSKQQVKWFKETKNIENRWAGFGTPKGGFFSYKDNEPLTNAVQILDRKTMAQIIERFCNK